MNHELEGLIGAYDAVKQAAPDEVASLRGAYESKLDDVLKRPNLSQATLEAMVRLAHKRWLKSQERPTTLPPQA